MTSTPQSSSSSLNLDDYPYLARLKKLEQSYPPLKSFLEKLLNDGENTRKDGKRDHGRRLVGERYLPERPGRCAVLTFEKDSVQHEIYNGRETLAEYFLNNPPELAASKKLRRLYILEDMEPGLVDLLGEQLKVDPLVYSEQLNSWHYTDSQSIPYRALPSMNSPERSWTLRYNEIRTLDDEDEPARVYKSQMTHAINRRKWERWQDVDLPSVAPDKRHAFIRRCGSFWTSHDGKSDGWNALMLVDPPLVSCSYCSKHFKNSPSNPNAACTPGCLLLEDKHTYQNRTELWKSYSWEEKEHVREVRHKSSPYHGGCPTMIPFWELSDLEDSRKLATQPDQKQMPRNLASAMDEMIFYWTECKHEDLEKTLEYPVNSACYLLKFIAYAWNNQLEFIGCSVANSEWFADDHEAKVGEQGGWKEELVDIAEATKNIQFMRRKMGHFESAMTLSLERLGVPVDSSPPVDNDPSAQPRRPLPIALVEAQRDFLSMSQRLQPFRQRIDDLSSIATDVAGLQVAFKSIRDSEQGLWLSVFAALVFPATFVASIFSMSDSYLPGASDHWVFWVTSVPLAIVVSLALMYGRGSRKPVRWTWQWLPRSRFGRKSKAAESV